jgi:predicted phosphodiesterase
MSQKYLKFALFSYLIFLYPLHAARVIIFSDIHGDIPYLTQTLTYMMAQKPTHLLANGDFVKFEQEKDLLGVFQKISEAAIQSKIPKENIFITPGNWEHTLWLSPEKVNNMLKAYGTLASPSYDKNGTVTISEGKIKNTLWVGHYPQFIIPAKAIPPEIFLYNFFDNQAHLLVTMDRKNPIPPETSLVVFSHTHVRAVFYDKKTKTLIINPGGLDKIRKSPEEICSYALYDTKKNTVTFFDANNGNQIGPNYPVKDQKNQFNDLHMDISDWNNANNGKGNLERIKRFLGVASEKRMNDDERVRIKWVSPPPPVGNPANAPKPRPAFIEVPK